MLKYLSTDGVDTGALQNGDAPLHAYIRRRDKQKQNCLMTFLIHAEHDVNLVNEEGDTALHLACKVSLSLSPCMQQYYKVPRAGLLGMVTHNIIIFAQATPTLLTLLLKIYIQYSCMHWLVH